MQHWTQRDSAGCPVTGRQPLPVPAPQPAKPSIAVHVDQTLPAPIGRIWAGPERVVHAVESSAAFVIQGEPMPEPLAQAGITGWVAPPPGLTLREALERALARQSLHSDTRTTTLLLQLDFYGPRGEIEVAASYTFDEACRGARERTGVALEPDTPAEVHLISLVTERGGVDLLPALDEALVRDVRMQILEEELHGR